MTSGCRSLTGGTRARACSSPSGLRGGLRPETVLSIWDMLWPWRINQMCFICCIKAALSSVIWRADSTYHRNHYCTEAVYYNKICEAGLEFFAFAREIVRVQFLIKPIEVTLKCYILISGLFVACGGGICRRTRRARPVAARLRLLGARSIAVPPDGTP